MSELAIRVRDGGVVADAPNAALEPLAAILNEFSHPRIARFLMDQLREGDYGRRTRIEWQSSDGRHTLVITADRMITARRRGSGGPGSSLTRHSIDRERTLADIERWASAVLATPPPARH